MFSLSKSAILGSAYKTKAPMFAESSSSYSPASAGFNAGGTVIQNEFSFSILEGFVDIRNKEVLYKLFREIYMMDAVTGPAVDQLASLPWSEYSILGINDPNVLQLYSDCLSELNLVRLMTYMSVSYLVLGIAIGSLVFDKTRGIFSDCILYNPDNCEITPIPFIGYDPKVDLKISPEIKKFLASKDARDLEALKELSPEFQNQLRSGTIPLEPLSTIILNRSTLPGVESLSYLTRVLPIWLVEKALTRGTLLASSRRQRGILHIQVGSDEWEPTEDQYQAIASMFANADRDPQGAIIVTRPDVQTSEVRSPTDFWNVSNDRDGFTQMKLRALGLNESWGTDATYSVQENSMTMFLENLNNFRTNLTKSILYDKVFLLLAKYHSFRRRTKAELNHNVRYDINSNHAARNTKTLKFAEMTASRNLAEASAYMIPELKWVKDLQNKGDSTALSLLQTAKDLGLPLPISLIATNAGIPIHTLLDTLQQDIEYRKKIKSYNDELAKLQPKEDEDGGGGGLFGSVKNDSKLATMQSTVQRAKDIASIKDSGMLKTYLFKNMPPNIPITPSIAKQICQFANNLKPSLISI